MNNEIKELIDKFIKIKQMGWIKSIQKGNAGIGRTFEHLLGFEANEFEIPDYNGIEIKTQNHRRHSALTLFAAKPESHYYLETERLRKNYGYPDCVLKEYNVLNTIVYCNKRTQISNKYQFMLDVDRNEQKIYLCIFNSAGELIERESHWDFDTLEEKLYRKLKTLAFIKAYKKRQNNVEYFKYYKLKIYSLKGFDQFINLIEQGIIGINFKIGIFKSGRKKGMTHDHGTSFNIKECDLSKLYDLIDRKD